MSPIKYYQGADGRRVVIKDMTDNHLQNAILYFGRRLDELKELEYDGYYFADCTGGEMAAESLLSAAVEMGYRASMVEDLLEALQKESERRSKGGD